MRSSRCKLRKSVVGYITYDVVTLRSLHKTGVYSGSIFSVRLLCSQLPLFVLILRWENVSDMGNCGSGGGGSVRELTSQEKTHIRESWAEFTDGDIVENGAHLYFKLFRDHPEAKDLFKFTKGKSTAEEDMIKDKQFRSHVKKVFDVLASAVSEMDDLAELGKDMHDLGARHYGYGVTMKWYTNIGQCIIYAIERKLGASFTKDRKKAWVALYGIIEASAKSGMEQKSREAQQQQHEA